MAALLVIPAAATAQGNPGPFGGLFGRTPDRVGQDYTVVEVRSSLGGFYDTSVLPGADADLGGAPQGAAGGTTNAALVLERGSDRMTASLAGSVAHEQYFMDPSSQQSTSLQGGARVAAKVTTRLNVDAGVNYAHSPYFQLMSGLGNPSMTTDFPAPISFGSAAAFVENETYNGSVALTAQLGKRTSFEARGYRQLTRFTDEPEHNLSINGARATLGHTLSRDLRAHAGYGREQSAQQVNGLPGFVIELIDIGVDFNRQLSLTRKTVLGFSTSTGIVKDQFARRFRLNGSLTLTKQFRRTWQAAAFANRGTEFRPGFVEPIFSDSVGGSFGGMLNRRVEWFTMVSASRGELAFSETHGFSNILATSQVTIGVTRHLGVYGQYASYFDKVPAGSTTLPLPGRLERRTVSVGLTAYIPVFNKVRATP